MTGRPRRILILENDQAVRQFLDDLLSEEGHRVETVSSLPDARHLLQSWQPDLLVTDLSVWDASLETLPGRLASEPALRDLPVVLCTAAFLTAPDVLPSYAPGLELVRKPFDVEDLLAAIDRLVARRGDRDAGGGGAD